MKPFSHAAPVSVMVMAWQVNEDGFDARPGDALSWRVVPVDPDWVKALRAQRSVTYMVDTHLHPEGARPPGFLRIDGAIASVEAVMRYDADLDAARPTIQQVGTTLADYGDMVDSFIVTLRAGARVSSSAGIDDVRYETSRPS